MFYSNTFRKVPSAIAEGLKMVVEYEKVQKLTQTLRRTAITITIGYPLLPSARIPLGIAFAEGTIGHGENRIAYNIKKQKHDNN